MSVVLGIGSSHDASAAVYVDGRFAALPMLERELPGFVQRGPHPLETVYWGPGYGEDAIGPFWLVA